MPLVAKELFDSYTIKEGLTSSSLTREFLVQDDSLKVVHGPRLALAASGLPALGEELDYEIGGTPLLVTDRDPKRYGPDSVKVTVTYGVPSGSAQNTTEMARAMQVDVPYDEQIDISGHDELIQADLDKRTIGLKAEGCNIQVPTLKWTFKVNVRPLDAWLLKFGYFNSARFFDLTQYPSGQRAAIALKRPYSFPAGTLLYLGATMQRTPQEEIGGYSWLWTAALTFVYDERGWEYYRWHSTVETPGDKNGVPLPTSFYYMDPFVPDPVTGIMGKETQYSIPSYKARVALYKKTGAVKEYTWNSRVRGSANFTTIFPFRWDL